MQIQSGKFALTNENPSLSAGLNQLKQKNDKNKIPISSN